VTGKPDLGASVRPYWESHLHLGGCAGTASGLDRVGGGYSLLEAFTELKTVVLTL